MLEKAYRKPNALSNMCTLVEPPDWQYVGVYFPVYVAICYLHSPPPPRVDAEVPACAACMLIALLPLLHCLCHCTNGCVSRRGYVAAPRTFADVLPILPVSSRKAAAHAPCPVAVLSPRLVVALAVALTL